MAEALKRVAARTIGPDRDDFLKRVAEAITDDTVQALVLVQNRDRNPHWEYLNPDGWNSALVGLIEWIKMQIFYDAQKRFEEKE